MNWEAFALILAGMGLGIVMSVFSNMFAERRLSRRRLDHPYPPGVFRCKGCGHHWLGAGPIGAIDGRYCLECVRTGAHRMGLGE